VAGDSRWSASWQEEAGIPGTLAVNAGIDTPCVIPARYSLTPGGRGKEAAAWPYKKNKT